MKDIVGQSAREMIAVISHQIVMAIHERQYSSAKRKKEIDTFMALKKGQRAKLIKLNNKGWMTE